MPGLETGENEKKKSADWWLCPWREALRASGEGLSLAPATPRERQAAQLRWLLASGARDCAPLSRELMTDTNNSSIARLARRKDKHTD